MGNYATQTQVEAHAKTFPGIVTPFTVSTTPTATEVTDFIAQIEAEINGVLTAQGYSTVPATGSNDVSLLRRYVSQKVAAMVWHALYMTTSSASEIPAHIASWQNDYKEFIARLRRGEQALIDQASASEDDGAFLVVRAPVRDDYFTDRSGKTTDWDE